jgi:hypothetical protein
LFREGTIASYQSKWEYLTAIYERYTEVRPDG